MDLTKPEVTKPEDLAEGKKAYDFMIAHGVKDSAGRGPGSLGIAPNMLRQYGATYGDRGPKDAGPTLLNCASENGNDVGASHFNESVAAAVRNWITHGDAALPAPVDPAAKKEAKQNAELLATLRTKVSGGADINVVKQLLGLPSSGSPSAPAATLEPNPPDAGYDGPDTSSGIGGPSGIKS
jgi:hypothetical protein